MLGREYPHHFNEEPDACYVSMERYSRADLLDSTSDASLQLQQQHGEEIATHMQVLAGEGIVEGVGIGYWHGERSFTYILGEDFNTVSSKGLHTPVNNAHKALNHRRQANGQSTYSHKFALANGDFEGTVKALAAPMRSPLAKTRQEIGMRMALYEKGFADLGKTDYEAFIKFEDSETSSE